jgi:hypothetical protein
MVTPLTNSASGLPEMSFGNMANDGGSLQLREAQVIDTIQNHFFDKRFIRLFLGSEKFIRGKQRKCMWVCWLGF